MKAGKIDIGNLKKLILDEISENRSDVLVRPKIGEDSAVIDFGEFVAVMSTDPITGVKEGIGSLAVNVACNDIAANGAAPIGIQQAILVPPSTTQREIVEIIRDINSAAQDLGIDILGGHTEVSDIVKQPLVVCTAIGKTTKDAYVTSSGAKVGDDIILTKWTGLEGTAILATDFYDQLISLGVKEELLSQAKSLREGLSVLPEGLLGANFKVNSMHDVTEGGLYGSLFELTLAAECGFEIDKSLLPLHPATEIIAQKLDINPYSLIGSGMMIMTTPRGEELVEELESAGIKATAVGKLIQSERRVIGDEDTLLLKEAPQDELWRFLAQN